jgi:DNA-binding IscR family transcriptional regulator
MIRLSKLADYGIVLLSYMAGDTSTVHTARDLAEASSLRLPTVSKILKALARSELLVSHRGANGGYRPSLQVKFRWLRLSAPSMDLSR